MLVCLGCGKKSVGGEAGSVCEYCGEILPAENIEIEDDIKQRLAFAHSLRRIRKFSDSKKEFNNILAMNGDASDNTDLSFIYAPGTKEAALGYFLSSYEVSDYKWNKSGDGLQHCNCSSTSLTPIEDSNFWRMVEHTGDERRKILCKAVDEKRKRNILIKENIPKYHAALICDPQHPEDIKITHKLYEIMSSKADIFFAPVTLNDIPLKDREFFIYQAIRNPEIVRLMFVVYSHSFDFQYTNNKFYQSDIVRQCEDFAKTHQHDELYSVILGDGAPSDDMNELSIKKIACRNVDDGASERIARAIMAAIKAHTCKEDEDEVYPLNDDGFSPIITPLKLK